MRMLSTLPAFLLLASLSPMVLAEAPATELEDLSFLGNLPISGLFGAPSDSSRVYVISGQGQLLRSDDGGSTFFARGLIADLQLIAILVHPLDADELFLTTNTFAIYHSTDGGFSASALDLPLDARGLWIDPFAPERLWSTRGRALLRRDPSEPWQELPLPLQGDNARISDLAFDPRQPHRILAAVPGGFGDLASGIYESVDDGISWNQRLAGASCARLVFDPLQQGSGVWAVTYPEDAAIWHSADGGRTWLEVDVPYLSWSHRLRLDPARPGYVLIASSPRHGSAHIEVLSRDGGSTWEQLELPTGGNRSVGLYPLSNGRWFIQSVGPFDSGIFESRDAGATWQERKALPSRVLALAVDPLDPEHAWAADDSGVFRTTRGGASWVPVFAPDVPLTDARLLVDPDDNRIVYFAHSRFDAGPFLWRSTDRGRTFFEVLRSTGAIYVTSLVAGRRGESSFVLASIASESFAGQLWRSTDQGVSWSSRDLESYSALSVDPSDGVVYQPAGAELRQSLDMGLSFTPIENFSGLGLRVLSIAAGAGHSLHVLTQAALYPADQHLFEIRSGPTPIERRLPDGPFCTAGILVPGRLPGQLFVSQTCGIESGRLWWSDDSGRSWNELWRGLPRGGLRDLVAAKDGASFWILPSDYGVFRGHVQSSQPRLSLQKHRFELEATFKDREGQRRQGQARYLTDQTGYFSFLAPGKVELAVKVLDGRPLTGAWWVFYASLTDVDFELAVTDLATGEVRRYHHPAGELASFGDLAALPDPSPLERSMISREAAVPLLLDRFEVTVEWRDFTGHTSGQPPARALDEDTASFSFFWNENVELIVRVFEKETGSGRFEVSFAALTNVEYFLKVRDTFTNEEWNYHNPLGVFASRTEAFLSEL